MRTIERQLLTAEKLGVLAAWLGTPADPGAILARLGARALQPDARPGLGRHDRPRLRGHDPELRVLPSRSDDLIDASWDVLAVEDRHPRAGDAGRRLQPPGLDPLGHRRGRGRLRRGGRHRRRADRPRWRDRAVADRRGDPLRRRRAQDGAGRVHRPRRPGPGLRAPITSPRVAGRAKPAASRDPAASSEASWRTTSIG